MAGHPDMDRPAIPPRGLPDFLPEGEHLLWQGAPEWRAVARRVFRIRWLAAYFAAMVAWRVVTQASDGAGAVAMAVSALWLVGLGLAAIGLLLLFSWLIGRTTVYTLTSRRLVLHVGIALPITLNLPFARIARAGVKLHGDGTADIPVSLTGGGRIAYLVLWPHARPWRVRDPEPMLRNVPDGARVAQAIARAMANAAGQAAAPAIDGAPVPARGRELAEAAA